VKGYVAACAVPAPPRLAGCKVRVVCCGCAQGVCLVLIHTCAAQAKTAIRCQDGTALTRQRGNHRRQKVIQACIRALQWTTQRLHPAVFEGNRQHHEGLRIGGAPRGHVQGPITGQQSLEGRFGWVRCLPRERVQSAARCQHEAIRGGGSESHGISRKNGKTGISRGVTSTDATGRRLC
jgi:hypothetical protein